MHYHFLIIKESDAILISEFVDFAEFHKVRNIVKPLDLWVAVEVFGFQIFCFHNHYYFVFPRTKVI